MFGLAEKIRDSRNSCCLFPDSWLHSPVLLDPLKRPGRGRGQETAELRLILKLTSLCLSSALDHSDRDLLTNYNNGDNNNYCHCNFTIYLDSALSYSFRIR